MYLYLYDSFLVEQKYRKIIDQIETRLTDLGISGRTIRLTILKNAREVIKDNLREEIDTVVVIGSDKLFSESAMALAGTEVALGFIPVGESAMADILDIPKSIEACDVVSGRRLQKIDLGRINGQYFLNSVQIDSAKVSIKCDNFYQIVPSGSIKSIKVINLDWLNFTLSEPDIALEKRASSAKDGLLEVVFSKAPRVTLPLFKRIEQKDSLFYAKRIQFHVLGDREIMARVDHERILKLPLIIEVIPKCLKLIVGRSHLI